MYECGLIHDLSILQCKFQLFSTNEDLFPMHSQCTFTQNLPAYIVNISLGPNGGKKCVILASVQGSICRGLLYEIAQRAVKKIVNCVDMLLFFFFLHGTLCEPNL